MKCNKCGAEFNEYNLKFCKKCGNPFMPDMGQVERTELFANNPSDNNYGHTELVSEMVDSQQTFGNQNFEQTEIVSNSPNVQQFANQDFEQTEIVRNSTNVQHEMNGQYGMQQEMNGQYGMQQEMNGQYGMQQEMNGQYGMQQEMNGQYGMQQEMNGQNGTQQSVYSQYNNGLNNGGQNSDNKKKFNPLFVVIPIVVVLLIAAGIVAFLLIKKGTTDKEPAETVEEKVAVQDDSADAPVSGPVSNESMVILQNGALAPGDFVVSDEIFYRIDHKSDVSYDEAFAGKNNKNNNMLWGGYGYTELKEFSMLRANYDVFNGKCVYFKQYVQDIDWNPTSDIESVVPAYSFGMLGNSREFAEATIAFLGIEYSSNDENPFYDATVRKQQRVYNDLLSKYGEELANEYFANYQKVLNSSFVIEAFLLVDETGTKIADVMTYGSMYIADLDDKGDGTFSLVDVYIDPTTFEMSIENPSHWITYDIDMADDFSYYDISYTDGSKMRLYKTSDKYLTGFVGGDAGAYNGIAGFGVAENDYYIPDGYNTEENKSEIDLYTDFSFILMTDGTMAVDPVVRFGENNRVSVSFNEVYNYASKEREPRNVSFEARYSIIGCGDTTNGGFALTDSTGTYCYNYTQDSYLRSKLDDEYVDNLDYIDLYAIITLNSRIGAELVKGFEEEGIVVTVDENSGSILLDNGVLFDLDKSDLSSDGEDYLTSVGSVYSSVINKDEYRGKVKTIKIDGYADPQGTYEHNQVLSEARAKTVRDYLASEYPDMTNLLESEGHSCDNPILAEDGTIDYAASRRVEISFIIDMDEYVAQDSPEVTALYGIFIGEEFGSKLELRSGGRGSFTNSGSTIPVDITWKVENDTVIINMPGGYELYSDYDTDTLRLENENEPRWKPDTFHRVSL